MFPQLHTNLNCLIKSATSFDASITAFLRGKDIEFELAESTVRDAKGGKDRVTMLRLNLSEALRRDRLRTKAQHEQALEDGFGTVHSTFALSRKSPNAARE